MITSSKIIKRFFSTFKHYKKLSCSAQEYLNVVINVPEYKLFLPWCLNSYIVSKKDEHNFEAILTVNFKIYEASYLSKVTCRRTFNGEYNVCSLSENNSVFKYLRSDWKIADIGENQCQIRYDVEFKFKNIIYQQISSYFINMIGITMNEAFEKRVLQLKQADSEALSLKQKQINKEKTEKIRKIDDENLKIKEDKTKDLKEINGEVIQRLKTDKAVKLDLGKLILEVLDILQVFLHQKKIDLAEYNTLLEIIQKNQVLSEFIVQAYCIFIEKREFYIDSEKKLLDYLKDVILMKKTSY